MKIPLQWQAPLKNEKVLWSGFAIFAIILIWASQPKSTANDEPPDIETAETFIPKGHLLIPVDLKNAERLDGLLGSHGIVDLYQAVTETQPHSKLVGRRFRLIRAPLNPQSFAVLIRDAEADRLAAFPGPFIASLRNQDSDAHEVVSSKPKPTIEYQESAQ